jgi:predicted signal transduction protein with EAL and GGDEF domain
MNPLFLKRHSLKTRVTLFTLGIFALGIWALTFYASRVLQADMQRILGEHQFQTVSLVAAHVNDELTERLEALERVANEMDGLLVRNPAALRAPSFAVTVPIRDPQGKVIGALAGAIDLSKPNFLDKIAQGQYGKTDTVARLGGDEFVVLLNELHADKTTSAEQAGVVAEKIRVALAAPYQLTVTQPGEPDTTVEHHCSASIGVVLFLNHLSSQTNLMKWADAAMYQAKDAGRNVVRFYEQNGPPSPADIA